MKELPMEEHLQELRQTLIRILIIIGVGFVVSFTFSGELSEFLLKPLRTALREGERGQIVYLGILDKVVSEFQMSFWFGVILSSPLCFRELWQFISPALYEHEAKIVKPFVVFGFLLFLLGIVFGYYIVFPFTFEVLFDMGVSSVSASIALKEYLLLAVKLLVGLGFIFQVPNILLILGFMGVVTKYSLKAMRGYVYVGLAVLSALLTPPDVFTMLALWCPLVFLYEVGIVLVAVLVHPYLKRLHS